DQRVAGLDPLARLGVPDHRHCRAVLHRAGGIVAFQLRQDDVLVLRDGIAAQALDAHERGVADEVLDGAVQAHACISSFTYAETPCCTSANSPPRPAARSCARSACVKLWYLPTRAGGNGMYWISRSSASSCGEARVPRTVLTTAA